MSKRFSLDAPSGEMDGEEKRRREVRERFLGIGAPREEGNLRMGWERVKTGLLGHIRERELDHVIFKVESMVDRGAPGHYALDAESEGRKEGMKLRQSNMRSGIPVRKREKVKTKEKERRERRSLIPVRKRD